MSVTMMTMESWLDEMLGDIDYPPDSEAGKLYPFFVRVGCVKRRPPRHQFFEYFLEMGRGLIEPVMYHEKLNTSHLAFVFPERWLGVAEQQAFTYNMSKHPEVDVIKSVDIITSSPLVIGSFMSEQIRILTWDEDSRLYDGSAEPT